MEAERPHPRCRSYPGSKNTPAYALLLLAFDCSCLRAAGSVDPFTLSGKVLLGYQDWFNCPGDGAADNNWRSWARGVPAADRLTVDLHPDLRELG
jgi:hypothetical protein